MFTNARNVAIFLLAIGLGETFGVLAAFLFSLPLFLSPLLILWLNVIVDGIPSIFFAFERTDSHAMQENPRAPADGLVSPGVRFFLYLSSLVIVLALCSLVLFLRAIGADQTTILTVGYLYIGMLGMGFIFVTRSFRSSFLTNMFAKTPLWIGVFFGVCFLIFPFITPSIRSFFGLVSLSVPMVSVVMSAVLLSLIPLDIAKRKLVHRSSDSNLLS